MLTCLGNSTSKLFFLSLPHLSLFQSCVLFLSLLPFIGSAALYFYLWIPDSTPSLLAAGVKSAPVLSLALMVLSYSGGRSLLGCAGGLLLSAGGDVCLIWPEHFLHGNEAKHIMQYHFSVSFST